MVIGHFGIGFGAKKLAPTVSLGLLFIGIQFLDLLWPTLVLLNVEHVAITPGITKMTPLAFTDYPYSHSLLMSIVWGILLGGMTWLLKKNIKYSIVLALCVVSHWVLDFLVHIPDLPLYPGPSPKFGLGLWNYPLIESVLEGGIFIIGLMYYLRTTTAKNNIGKYGLWVLVALLVIVQVSNMLSPPPASVAFVAWGAQFLWLFVALGFWVDHHREVTV